MNNIDIILFSLLKEVKNICNDNQIDFYVLGDAVLYSYKNIPFNGKLSSIDVGIPYRDIDRFCRAAETKSNDKRILESKQNNPNLNSDVIRYVDKGSFYKPYNNKIKYTFLGLAINIFPMKSVEDDMRKQGNKQGAKEKSLLDSLIGLIKNYKTSRHQQAPTTYNNRNDTFYIERHYKARKVIFPKRLFGTLSEIKINGETYVVPADEKSFFSAQYGLNWQNSGAKYNLVGKYSLISPTMPYEVFLNNDSCPYSDKDVRSAISAEHRTRVNQKMESKRIDDAWYIVLRSGARFNLWEEYMPEKERILDLYEHKKWQDLKEVLSHYDKIMLGYYNRKMSVFFDRDIFEIYLEMLKHYKMDEIAEEFRRNVPEEHLNETISLSL